MTVSSTATLRRRLAQVTAHLVVGVVALVVIGGATRVIAPPTGRWRCRWILPGESHDIAHDTLLTRFLAPCLAHWPMPPIGIAAKMHNVVERDSGSA